MEHIIAWCAAQYSDREEAIKIASKILDFSYEHGEEWAAQHTYRELLDMIERNEREGIK